MKRLLNIMRDVANVLDVVGQRINKHVVDNFNNNDCGPNVITPAMRRETHWAFPLYSVYRENPPFPDYDLSRSVLN